MISKAKIKYIRSLELKKNRRAEGVFVAEGPKVVGDLLERMPAQMLVATHEWAVSHPREAKRAAELVEVEVEELQRVSFLQHPQEVLAVFPMMAETAERSVPPRGCLSLCLDGVQDPGNLGTIIRIADWFGIEHIFCSTDTADVYNPKVVQATMGSLARVQVTYTPLEPLLKNLPDHFPVYGTFLDGNNIYAQHLSNEALIVMGNEGKGISPAVAACINRKLLVPNFPQNRSTADSLNVAVATAIVCAEFRRQHT